MLSGWLSKDSYLFEDIGNLDEGILGEIDECGDAEKDDNLY